MTISLRRMGAILAAALAVAFMPLASATAADTKHDYPAKAERSFLKGCYESSGGMKKACNKVLVCVENRLSFPQFLSAALRLEQGDKDTRGYRVIKSCSKRVATGMLS